jgi:hypothetical protein
MGSKRGSFSLKQNIDRGPLRIKSWKDFGSNKKMVRGEMNL